MIPKVIHYCWFGRNPLPDSAIKCIESWKKFFPDYEIRQWNEDNFDVNSIPYTSEAYEAGKYAFVSDYARFKILYENGGLYFDTDVEVIKSFDDIISNGSFMGCEISTNKCIYVNPGLGMGAIKNLRFYSEVLKLYSTLNFIDKEGNLNFKTVVSYTTELLQREGLETGSEIQKVADITIYPKEYFNPFDDNTGVLKITGNTHSIHWYSKTWLNENQLRIKISRLSHRIFGIKFTSNLRKIFKH